ncbi:PhzF family phenazine biosynthesis protein, partial [Gordoniibacillus kamchatkensis]|uniref:PhzF family phenazine biosynthesis protein n=1 Tax=Gordoniibacillus kamchatkensis TaxID=1590651 RepID=UPI0012E060B6
LHLFTESRVRIVVVCREIRQKLMITESRRILIQNEAEGTALITMRQSPAQFVAFEGRADSLASSIGLSPDDLDPDLPIVYGSTGIWTLLVPVKRLEAFTRMAPDNNRFPEILQQMPRASVHPFCLETYDAAAHMHARHFSSPFSGTTEDPVTGTASGVMGAYYARYIRQSAARPLQLVVEQGHEIGREGRVHVSVTPSGDTYEVEISGSGVYVADIEVQAGDP